MKLSSFPNVRFLILSAALAWTLPLPAADDIHARWIAKFERSRLDALAALKQRLEGDNDG